MSEETEPREKLTSRIGKWFKRDTSSEAPLDGPSPAIVRRAEDSTPNKISIFRPWARKEQQAQAMAKGFNALGELMSSIRDNLQDQGHRQDELLKYLSHLPQAMQSLPESNRLQTETLKAIHAQMEQQGEQQALLAEVLNKAAQSDADQKKVMNEMRERVETLHEHDAKISDNLSSVGAAMQGVSRNTHTSAQVLEQMRDNINARDGQLERILQKQTQRFTIMLVIAIVISVIALGAVGVMGYLMLNRDSSLNRGTPTTQPMVPARF